MHLHMLSDELWFPPVEEALPDGLLALGGDMNPDRLLLAYSSGIFPWYDDDLPLWWSPDPRFVLFPHNLRISKSMKQLLKKEVFDFRMNTSFEEVLINCKTITRKDQDGTWINDEMITSYMELHNRGYAQSAEVWQDDELVGGLFGMRVGNVFCGDSMFSRVSNASKYAFIKYVQWLQQDGVVLIDCQVPTPHLESLGAATIPRDEFIDVLKNNHATVK